MTILAPDRQSVFAPAWLVNFTGAQSKAFAQLDFIQNDFIQRGLGSTVPTLFASRDLDVSGTFYHGRILQDPVVDQGFFDSFFGVSRVTTVSFRLANADNALDTLHTVDLRGTTLSLTRYDEVTGTSVTEFTGKVSTTSLGDGWVEIEAVSPDLSVFETLVPLGTVTAAVFTGKAVDLGATIPVVFGNVVQHRCPYINDDTTTNVYDYLVGRGSLTVTAVYRDGPGGTLHLVGASEYTAETTRYSGMTSLRFTTRQVNFSNAFHGIFADVTGLSAERNFARAVKTLLSDTTYGLSQSVNAASFTTAEGALPATLYCDGAMAAPRAASDVLRDLLMVRGMRLALNGSGEWTCTVDSEQADVRMTVQDGTADGERNLLAVTSPRRRPSLQDSVLSYKLRFRWDPVLGDYRLVVSRAVHSGLGRDLVLEHPYIRDTTTADTVIAYLAQREIYGNETVDVDVTQEARKIVPGERVTLTYAPLGFAAQPMEVRGVRKGLDRISMTLGLWSANFYTYTAGTLPTDPSVPTPTESAKTTRTDTTAPATPTGLTATTGTGAAVSLDWTDNTEEDLTEYAVYRHTADVPASATKIAKVRASRFVDVDVTISTPYYYWVTALDFQMNESAKTASVTATPGTVTGDQIAGGTIPFQKLTLALGPEVAGFAWVHGATFGATTPKNSYRTAIPLGIYGPYTVQTGDRLEYDIGFSAASVDTRGGLDLGAIERSNTAAAAAATTLTLDAGASAVDNAYTNMWLEITGAGNAAAVGQVRMVTGYVGATKVATVATWTTTPTGTITYTLRRVLRSEAGVVDNENSLGAAPSTQLGSRALGQWYHRTIPLPSAWVGKAIDIAGTGLDNNASGAVEQRITNARITSSAGALRSSLQVAGFTAQGAWAFGTEQNVTSVAVSLDSGGLAVNTQGLGLLAAGRGAVYRQSGSVTTNTGAEVVVYTLTNFLFVASDDDVALFWFKATLRIQDTLGGTGCTGTVRLRRGTTTAGTLILSATVNNPGTKGVASVVSTIAQTFDIDVNAAAAVAPGYQTYVITLQTSVATNTVATLDVPKLMALAKSR